MNKNGHAGLTTQSCGFIVHPTKGWLGASPDARVSDPSRELFGIAEFKCPYTKRDVSPATACDDPNFYGELVDAVADPGGVRRFRPNPPFWLAML